MQQREIFQAITWSKEENNLMLIQSSINCTGSVIFLNVSVWKLFLLNIFNSIEKLCNFHGIWSTQWNKKLAYVRWIYLNGISPLCLHLWKKQIQSNKSSCFPGILWNYSVGMRSTFRYICSSGHVLLSLIVLNNTSYWEASHFHTLKPVIWKVAKLLGTGNSTTWKYYLHDIFNCRRTRRVFSFWRIDTVS